MIVEYVRYTIPEDQAATFLSAYAEAATALEEAPECLSYELTRGVEEPEHWILRIEWTSKEDHEHGFRGGPAFARFFAAIRPYVAQIDEMKHYERTAVASA
jgi:quinol monooxygenase YgiN